jgi:hypothetical protein
MTIVSQTKVLPGHKIEFSDKSLPEGAEVTVTVELTPQGKRISAIEYLKSLPPRARLYATLEEASNAIREERDSWE